MVNELAGDGFVGADFKQGAGNFGADDLCGGGGDHEPGQRAGAVTQRKPVSEVNENAGEKTSLGDAQKKAGGIKLRGRFYQSGERGDNAPGDHDAADKAAGAPAFDGEGAGDFEEKVTDKKYAGRGAEDGVVEAEVFEHRQLGDGKIDAVDIGDHIAEKKQRRKPQVGFPAGAVEGGGVDGEAQAGLKLGLGRGVGHTLDKIAAEQGGRWGMRLLGGE